LGAGQDSGFLSESHETRQNRGMTTSYRNRSAMRLRMSAGFVASSLKACTRARVRKSDTRHNACSRRHATG
jgi:hypothetical protein